MKMIEEPVNSTEPICKNTFQQHAEMERPSPSYWDGTKTRADHRQS